MSSFFFYRQLKNENLLNLISNYYTIQDAFILVNAYDETNNIIKIEESSNLNNKILKGKYVTFPLYSYYEILDKIGAIEEIKNINKQKYKVEKIECYFDFDFEKEIDLIDNCDYDLRFGEKKEAFIIY